jgi:hypothetical protein
MTAISEKDYHEILDPLIRHLGLKDHAKSSYNNNNGNIAKIDTLKSLSAVSKHARTASLVALRDHADHKISESEDIVNVMRAIFDPEFKKLIESSPEKSQILKQIESWFKVLIWSSHEASKDTKKLLSRDPHFREDSVQKYSIPVADSIIVFLVLYQQSPTDAFNGSFRERPPVYGGTYSRVLDQFLGFLSDQHDTWEDVVANKQRSQKGPTNKANNRNAINTNTEAEILLGIIANAIQSLCKLLEGARSSAVAFPSPADASRYLEPGVDAKTVLSDLLKAFQPRALLHAARTIHFFPSWYATTKVKTLKDMHRLILMSPIILEDVYHLFQLYQFTEHNNNNNNNNTKVGKKGKTKRILIEEALRIKHLASLPESLKSNPKYSFSHSHENYRTASILLRMGDMALLVDRAVRVFIPSTQNLKLFPRMTMPHHLAVFIYTMVVSSRENAAPKVVHDKWRANLQSIFVSKSLEEDLPPGWAKTLDFDGISSSPIYNCLIANRREDSYTLPEYGRSFRNLTELYDLDFRKNGPRIVKDVMNKVISREARELSRVMFHKQHSHYKIMFAAYSMIVSFYVMQLLFSMVLLARRENTLPSTPSYSSKEWHDLTDVCIKVKQLWKRASSELDQENLSYF